MGKGARKKAISLGFTNFRETILFCRPKKIRMMFSKYMPDTADAVKEYLKQIDPTTEVTSSGGGRNNTFYMLAPQAQLYVELADKMAGMAVPNSNNHVIKMNIFCNNDEYIHAIANTAYYRWDDGLLNHIDLKKIEKKYKVKSEDVLAAWKAIIGE